MSRIRKQIGPDRIPTGKVVGDLLTCIRTVVWPATAESWTGWPSRLWMWWLLFGIRSSKNFCSSQKQFKGPQGADTSPPPSPSPRRWKAGRNQLNEEITPLLPTGIGERFSHIKFRTCSALAPMCAELTRGAL
jgi:hypothetical protein